MPGQNRARLAVDERRVQLLELGLKLFGQRSYESISINDIAEAAQISRGLLYHYFRSKRGFYVATIRYGAEQLRARVEPELELPAPERLRAGLEAYLDFVTGDARVYVTLMRSGVGFDPEIRAILEGTRDGIIARTVANLSEEFGAVEDQGLLRVALRGWLGMVEFASLEWLEHPEVAREELLTLFVAAFNATLASAIGEAILPL